MRITIYSLLSLAAIATTFVAGDAVWGDDDKEPEATKFNGEEVPPLIALTPKTLDSETRKGNWIVEFFSPECPHCTAFAPMYQTIYEFYYTSKPIASNKGTAGDNLNSFTRYYDFKFARVNCLAYVDSCEAHGITSYPSMIYIKDGKEVGKNLGAMTMKSMSAWVEELLEKIRPGSRKAGGPMLPKVGADSVEPDTEAATQKKAKADAGEKSGAEAVAQKKDKADAGEKSEAAQSATKAAKPTPARLTPVSTANPSGMVQPLTNQLFPLYVTNSQDPWFIKFYAPWCHHCQAMGPTWAALARQMQNKLNIAEVDCDAEPKLCQEAGVKGYPTILLFRGRERIEYQGLRGLGDFLDYAGEIASISDGVRDIDADGFTKMEDTEEVIFTYFYDHATTSEDFQAVDRLLLGLVGHGKLVKTNDKALYDRFKITTWPRLMVSRDGKATYYPPTTPKDMRDTKKISAWIKSVWLPIVPELTSANAREITGGKLVVLGIVDPEHPDQSARSKKELKRAALQWIDKVEEDFKLERQRLRDAKQLKIEDAESKGDQKALNDAKNIRIDMKEFKQKQVAFAWVNGAFWERWIKSTYGVNVKQGEKVVINDEDNYQFWDTNISGKPIAILRSEILATIPMVMANPPKIAAKSTSNAFMSTFRSVHRFCTNSPFLALGLVVGSIALLVLTVRSRRTRRHGKGSSFYHGEKDGLLGGSGNGAKHD